MQIFSKRKRNNGTIFPKRKRNNSVIFSKRKRNDRFFPQCYKFRDHHRRSLGHLWAFCGFSVSNICASIIMMQKVAANVDNVAADLCFRASEVRWLLMKIFFCYCRYFCRYFLCTSINIVMPYLRHFSSFVPKIFPKVSNREQGYSFTFV